MLTTISLFLYSFSSPPPVSTRRRSLVVPKSYTFAPNLTPISYPSDRTSPTDENTPPSPLSPSSSASPTQSPAGEREPGTDADTKSENMDDASANTVDLPMPPPTRPRRRGPRRDSVEHIPRPPNAFMLFRQNFVHQRHVPGSIETNHNSLSRIVGEYTPLIIQLCFSHFPPLLRWLRRPYAPSRPSSPPVKPTFLFGFGSASIFSHIAFKNIFSFPSRNLCFYHFSDTSNLFTGNHWKALPATEKKRWEQLADKKKEEHKRLYPDYRFQPKHDPEKKRRRQEAKAAAEAAAIRDEQQRRADEERKRREIEGPSPLAMPMPMPVPGTMSANVGGGTGTPVDEAQQSMQLRRNQERERRAQHFGHRRSSSVPLPMDTYAHAAYPYGHTHAYAFPPAFSAQAQANPFNFANPALASAGAGASSHTSAGAGVQQIALPTLPTMGADAGGSNGGLSNLSNMLPAWYTDTNNNNNNNASAEQHAQSLSAGATPASGELQLPTHLQGPFGPASTARQTLHQKAATLSRAGSPRLAHSLRQQQQFAPQQGMGMLGNMALYNQMHMGFGMGMGPGGGMNANMNTNGGMSSYMNMNTGMSMGMNSGMPLGMGARAARQHQLGQLGRRASSTQPVLQHQLASGAFAHFGAHANNNAFSFTPTTAPALPPPSANVGFTNPFASSSASASNNGAIGATGATGEGVNGFPHPFAPQSIWFESAALPDPNGSGAGTGAEPEPLPEVDSYLLNPAFRFGTSNTDGASSTSTTASTTTTNNNNNNNNNNATSNNSNGTPPPPPSAGPRGSFDFTAIMMNLPRAGAGHGAGHGGAGYAHAPNVDVSISPLENIPPHQRVPLPVPTPALAQPVPLRKVAVPEPEAYPAQEYAQQQEYHYASHYVPHASQQQQHGQHDQQQQLQGQGLELEYVYGGGAAHAQEYFQNSQPSSVASGSPDLSASGSGSPHGFGAAEMHSQESQSQSQGQNQSQSQESTPTEMRPLPHAQGTVAGTELLDGAHPQQYEQQYEQYEQHHQQQFEHAHQGQSVYEESGSGPESGPLSASLGGSMGVGVDAPGALGLYYDHAHPHPQHQHQYQLEQQQQHGEDLQTYMSAAAGVCSGVDVLDNYALGLPVSVVDRHGHHAHGQAHGYADPASAGQGFEFSDFVHDSPYLGTGAMGAAAN